MFGKPKRKPIGVGEPRDEAERQKVNATLLRDYGIKEAFAKPVNVIDLAGTRRVKKGMGSAASGIKTDWEKEEEKQKKGKK
jgi:hypothetical protein